MHQSKVHPSVSLETFIHDGGSATSGILPDQIREKVMTHSQCERHVDGIAETLEKELNLGQVCCFILAAIDSD